MTLFDTYRVTRHLLDLENNWAVWCEYLEGQQDLDMLMATDRNRLYALLCRRETGQRVTKMDVLKELEVWCWEFMACWTWGVMTGVCGMVVKAVDYRSNGLGFNWMQQDEGLFFTFPESTLVQAVNACLTFACTACLRLLHTSRSHFNLLLRPNSQVLL